MSFAGGSGAVDEFGGVGRPRAVRVPWVAHHSASPVPESGRVRSRTWQRRDPPGTADGGQDAAPGADAAFLLAGIEEHERGMGDLAHDGQRGGVGSWIMPALVSGSVYSRSRAMSPGRRGADGARDDDPEPVQQLPAGGAPQPPAGDGQPLHDGTACDGYPGQGRRVPRWGAV